MMSYGFTSLKAPETEECVSNWSETRSESIHAIRSQRRTVTGWVPMSDAKRGTKRVAGIKNTSAPHAVNGERSHDSQKTKIWE